MEWNREQPGNNRSTVQCAAVELDSVIRSWRGFPCCSRVQCPLRCDGQAEAGRGTVSWSLREQGPLLFPVQKRRGEERTINEM